MENLGLGQSHAAVRTVLNEDTSIDQTRVQTTLLETLANNINSSIACRKLEDTEVLLALIRVVIRRNVHEPQWIRVP